ncbi:MAG: two-component system sensor histidine kinase NtrB [Desulfosudaceae bacterium]
MNHHYSDTGSLLRISPFFIIGLLLILVPIFTFITIDNIRTHDKRIMEQLTARGASLIRAFEAGTRTGVTVMNWDTRNIKWLLTEIARQPEIEYMMIINRHGKILAHSDPGHPAKTLSRRPELPPPGAPPSIHYRRVNTNQDKSFFEVFKKFTPDKPWQNQTSQRPVTARPLPSPLKDQPRDWCRQLFSPDGHADQDEPFILAGFGMDDVKKAQREYIRHIVMTGATLFLIGCGGIISLSAVLAYRSAKSSFVQMKAFSDEVVANMPAGLITIAPDRSLIWCNTRGDELLREFSDHPDHHDLSKLPFSLLSVAEQVMATRHSLSTEVELTGSDGKLLILDVSASPIQEQDGSISGYLLLFKDLTDIRNLEKEIARSKHLAAIGKLAAGVAHEIRNPLSSIKGLATYFKENSVKARQDYVAAETLLNEVERLNLAVAQLLEFAHPIALNLTEVSLQELLDHSLRLVENDLKRKEISYQATILCRQDVFETDRDRMIQILLNLYLNAIEAMSAGDSLSVTVADPDTAEGIVLEVSDTGQGIPADELDHIFDPYFTTRNDGTGLGLSIVYKLVETLGGEISAESVVDQGTVFRIWIPRGARGHK